MNFEFLDPWHGFLPREGGHILAFMGSGGKTSLMQAIAEVYAAQSLPVVLTTTTRCEVLADLPEMTWDQLQGSAADQCPGRFYLHAGLDSDGKWSGLAPDQVDELGRLLPAHIVLAEVDGSAGKALKIHRDGEPVWPARTSLAFVVMGLDAVGGRLDNHVHRWDRGESPLLAGLPAHEVLTWSHVRDLLLEPGGYLAQVPREVPAVLALGQLDLQDDSIGLFEFVGQAMEHPAFPLALFSSLGPEGPSLRTACRPPTAEPA